MDNINQSINVSGSQPVQEIKPMKKEINIFKYLFFITFVILIITIIGSYFYYTETNKERIVVDQNDTESIPVNIVSNNETQESSNIDIDQIYQQALKIAKSQTDLTISTDNNFGTVWTTSDNETVFIKDNNTSFEVKSSNYQNLPTLNNKIVELLSNNNNFYLNSKNTIKNTNYSFNSYEDINGNYKCVIYFPNQIVGSSSNSKSPLNFTCFAKDQLETNYQEQISFIQDLNLKNSIIFNINTKNNEAILKLTDRERMSMTVINPNYFAYKSGDNWNYIFSGNDICSCEDLVKRNVPKEHWIGCSYKDNSYVKGNFSLE